MAKKENTFEALRRLGLCHVTHSLKEPQGDASICSSVFFPPFVGFKRSLPQEDIFVLHISGGLNQMEVWGRGGWKVCVPHSG